MRVKRIKMVMELKTFKMHILSTKRLLLLQYCQIFATVKQWLLGFHQTMGSGGPYLITRFEFCLFLMSHLFSVCSHATYVLLLSRVC